MRIGLVFGGNTTEGEVSKNSAIGIRGALMTLGYEIVDIEFDKNIALHIQDANVDVVFNAMHGQYGEDGCLQGLLDIMQIPYTHSGKLASAIAMNKKMTNKIISSIGIKTIDNICVSKEDICNDNWKNLLNDSNIGNEKEFFIKPVSDGSSRDTFLVHSVKDFSFRNIELSTSSKEFLIEKRIIGREIQVAVLGNKAIGLLEVVPNREFYDYTAKYSEGGAKHIVPILDEEIKENLLLSAEKMHNIIGLKDISRSEFILTKDNDIYALEINSHPGFTPISIFPEIAKNNGISYEDIVQMLVKNAKFG